ncbi:MAG: hypothetical protein SPE24_08315 [Erysipelotrichaceae bacterium]|nr:hypothetical protein [Erysipelotrichaceae bacterium]
MKNLANIDEESANYKFGVSVGVLAACKIVLKKLNNPSKSFMDRISDVKTFCNNPYPLVNQVNGKDKEIDS